MNVKEPGVIERMASWTMKPCFSLQPAEKCAAVIACLLSDTGDQASFLVLIDDVAGVSGDNGWRWLSADKYSSIH